MLGALPGDAAACVRPEQCRMPSPARTGGLQLVIAQVRVLGAAAKVSLLGARLKLCQMHNIW